MMTLRESDVARLLRAADASRDNAARWAGAFIDAMREGGIDTPLRIGHFISQCGHESAHFRTTTEYASGAAYEGRRDLGNVYPGDGKKYRGRGFIMLTGRANYTGFNRWLRANVEDAPNVVDKPELVAQMPWAMLASTYFWQRERLNDVADRGDTRDDVRRVTKIINGGYNGIADRISKFVAVMGVLRQTEGFASLGDQVALVGGSAPVDAPAPVEIEPIPARPPTIEDDVDDWLDGRQATRPGPPWDGGENSRGSTSWLSVLIDAIAKLFRR